MIAEIQVLPAQAGSTTSRWAHVDAAIAAVAATGLTYEVGPLGTTIEGAPDAVWQTLRRAHEATLRDGAASVVSVIKVFESIGEGPSMHTLTARHRHAQD